MSYLSLDVQTATDSLSSAPASGANGATADQIIREPSTHTSSARNQANLRWSKKRDANQEETEEFLHEQGYFEEAQRLMAYLRATETPASSTGRPRPQRVHDALWRKATSLIATEYASRLASGINDDRTAYETLTSRTPADLVRAVEAGQIDYLSYLLEGLIHPRMAAEAVVSLGGQGQVEELVDLYRHHRYIARGYKDISPKAEALQEEAIQKEANEATLMYMAEQNADFSTLRAMQVHSGSGEWTTQADASCTQIDEERAELLKVCLNGRDNPRSVLPAVGHVLENVCAGRQGETLALIDRQHGVGVTLLRGVIGHLRAESLVTAEIGQISARSTPSAPDTHETSAAVAHDRKQKHEAYVHRTAMRNVILRMARGCDSIIVHNIQNVSDHVRSADASDSTAL